MPEFLADPSVLTKEKLKSELIANNVSLPGGEQRKDVYVQLYLQHLTARNPPATPAQPDFSSDEEREHTPLGARNRGAAVGRVSTAAFLPRRDPGSARVPSASRRSRARFPARMDPSARGLETGVKRRGSPRVLPHEAGDGSTSSYLRCRSAEGAIVPGGDGPYRLGWRGRGALPRGRPGRRTVTRGVGAGQPPASPLGRVPRVALLRGVGFGTAGGGRSGQGGAARSHVERQTSPRL